ncbi:MAG: hypothetical protein CMM16_06115 [Rhodospirillaceae bacterium]|nr:hypothetical protein [Rhodospirillaceae bacterium]
MTAEVDVMNSAWQQASRNTFLRTDDVIMSGNLRRMPLHTNSIFAELGYDAERWYLVNVRCHRVPYKGAGRYTLDRHFVREIRVNRGVR